MKTFFKTAGIMLICFIVFTGSSYLYLRFDRDFLQTEKTKENVPYYSVPDNCGLSVILNDNSCVFLELDFEKNTIYVILTDAAASKAAKYGYTSDYSITGNSALFEGIIDRIGGIEITQNNETLRYTGIQAADLILKTDDEKQQVITAFFERCAETGLTRQDFIFIIENSTTDLSVPTCYMWPEHIKEMCLNIQFLN